MYKPLRQDRKDYAQKLIEAGAEIVLSNVEKLDIPMIEELISIN